MRQACTGAGIVPDGDVVGIPAAAFLRTSTGPTEEATCRPVGDGFFLDDRSIPVRNQNPNQKLIALLTLPLNLDETHISFGRIDACPT